MWTKGLIIFCVIILIVGSLASPSFAALFKTEAQWNEYKSEHFIISYRPSISEEHVREFARNCERYYHLITERLGFARFEFWLWENRARVFIYKNKQDYLNNTAQPQWSGAAVHTAKKFIETYYFEEDSFDSVLPHELTHIILREFIGSEAQVPLWFEEGAACVNERDSSQRYLSFARKLVEEQNFISVAEMEAQNAWSISSPEIFYPLAASLAIFLLDNYDGDCFVRLCRELRDGADFYRGMDKIYGIKNTEDLNEKFLNFMRK